MKINYLTFISAEIKRNLFLLIIINHYRKKTKTPKLKPLKVLIISISHFLVSFVHSYEANQTGHYLNCYTAVNRTNTVENEKFNSIMQEYMWSLQNHNISLRIWISIH